MKKFFALLLVLAALATGCSPAQTGKDTAETQKRETSQQEYYLLAGKIESGHQVNLSSKISARVAGIKVDIGDSVKEGQPLVYLDVQDISAQVRVAQAAVNTAEANLAKVESGARSEQIAQAKSAVESAKTAYSNSKVNLDRMKQLYQQGGVTQQQVEGAQSAYAAADAAYQSAVQQLNMLTKGETKETVNILRSQVEQARSSLEAAQVQQSNGVIVSPINGTVSSRDIDQGELAAPGITLLSLVSSSSFYITAQSPSDLVGQFKEGQTVIVRVKDLDDKKFTGKISSISPAVDPRSKTVQVKVAFDGGDSLLKAGMVAEIGILK